MRIRLADFIAEWAAGKGIRRVFTVTGGGAMHLNDALGKNRKLKCVYNHHEQASAMAAESYARINRKPALVCVTSGPGGTNAITGVLGGWLDSVPMLVISGQVKYETTARSTGLNLRQLGDQEFDITKCVSTMTKYSVMVTDPLSILYHLERAYFLALNGRPGPCWLDIPINVQSAVIDTGKLKKYDPKQDRRELPAKVARKTALLVLDKIKKSQRPVILAGSAVRSSGGLGDFYRLAKKLNVPIVTAWNAHDAVWDSHPLYFGRPGTVGDRPGNFIIQNADLVLVIGCRLNIRQISYNWKTFAKNAYKIVVDIDKNELKKPTVSPDMPVAADAADFIRALSGAARAVKPKKQWLEYCRKTAEKFPIMKEKRVKPAAKVNPYYFVRSFTGMLKENDITVTGNGSACVITFQAAIIKKGQRLYTNSGCASMGYDIPAAIGAHEAAGRKVYCIAGDGSMQMNIQELQTIARNKMDITIIVLNNDGYHSIRQTQEAFFGRPLVGVNSASGISFPDAEKISRAYGIRFVRAASNRAVKAALKKALKSKGPCIFEVVADPAQKFEPKLASKRLKDGSMYSPPLEDMYPFLDRKVFDEAMSVSKAVKPGRAG